MCEEPGCEALLDVRDPAEGRCVGEVEVCESHFGWIFGGEIWLRSLVYRNWIYQCIVGLWERGCVFHGVRGRLLRRSSKLAPIRFDKRRPSAICVYIHWTLATLNLISTAICVDFASVIPAQSCERMESDKVTILDKFCPRESYIGEIFSESNSQIILELVGDVVPMR